MGKIGWLVFALVVFGAWHHYRNPEPGQLSEVHGRVIMYSQTTCGYCVQKKQELRAAGIIFEEYFIDTDANKLAELQRKLGEAGYRPSAYGTPILDVHGFMLPNNPSLDTIRKHL